MRRNDGGRRAGRAMVLAKATVIGAGLVLAPFDAARAQGGVADSVLRATRHWIDSLDARSGRRWPAGCPSYSDFPYMATTIPGCQISGIPAPTSYDTARVLSFQHLESPFMHAGPPRPVERLDAADSIPIVVGDWHGLIRGTPPKWPEGRRVRSRASRRRGVVARRLRAPLSQGSTRGIARGAAIAGARPLSCSDRAVGSRSAPEGTLAARARQHDACIRRRPTRRSRVRSHAGRLLPSRARGCAATTCPALHLRVRSGWDPGGGHATRERMQVTIVVQGAQSRTR